MSQINAASDNSKFPQNGAAKNSAASSLSESEQRLLKEISNLQAQREGLQNQIKDLTNSTSWKITKPLRVLAEALRKIRPLWRTKLTEFDLRAYRHTRIIEKTGILIEGTSPSIELVPREHAKFPTSWCYLSSKLETEQLHTFFSLYYKGTQDYCDANRILLPLGDATAKKHLIQLPHNTAGIRIDPFLNQGTIKKLEIQIQEIGKLQVGIYFFEKYVLSSLKHPKQLLAKFKKLFALLREGGLVALKMKLFANSMTNNYDDWVKRYDTLSEQDREGIRSHIKTLEQKPLISVLMPTYNTPELYLRRVIESVQRQLYPNWELCIADDNSPQARVREVIQEYASKDSRIKYKFRESNGHISATTNTALELAAGEYVAFLDHDDEISEHALYYVAVEINRYPDAKLIYSDEDKLTGFGLRFNPYFKSDWNPELLMCQNFVCHLTVAQTKIVKEVGGLRSGSGIDGAQDWDLVLRISRKISENQIRHIPHILYHWRVIEGSTAQSTAFKPYVLDAQKKLVSEHLKAMGVEGAEVETLHSIAHQRVKFSLPNEHPLVSIIIPTRDKVSLLKCCVDSLLEKSTYQNFEILIVDNGSQEPETFAYFEMLKKWVFADKSPRVKIIRDDGPFNFSRINNQAVPHAKGEIIGFLNNDLEVISADWLEEMLSRLLRSDNTKIGAIGARLLWPNNLLQHGGIILGIGGVAGHNLKGRKREDPGYWNRAILPQNLSAVTAACMLMPKAVFLEVGGFDEVNLAVAFNDTDLCLKVREKGYKIIYTPYAEFYHHESASRGFDNTPQNFLRFEREISYMKKRWGNVLLNDPYYNPNLTLLSEDYGLSFPPRTERPWKVSKSYDRAANT